MSFIVVYYIFRKLISMSVYTKLQIDSSDESNQLSFGPDQRDIQRKVIKQHIAWSKAVLLGRALPFPPSTEWQLMGPEDGH